MFGDRELNYKYDTLAQVIAHMAGVDDSYTATCVTPMRTSGVIWEPLMFNLRDDESKEIIQAEFIAKIARNHFEFGRYQFSIVEACREYSSMTKKSMYRLCDVADAIIEKVTATEREEMIAKEVYRKVLASKLVMA